MVNVMRSPALPMVRAYHPRIGVRDGSKVRTITGNLPDWKPDGEYLGDLKRVSGARTAGDLVKALESGVDDGFDSHIDDGDDYPIATELNWNDVI